MVWNSGVEMRLRVSGLRGRQRMRTVELRSVSWKDVRPGRGGVVVSFRSATSTFIPSALAKV